MITDHEEGSCVFVVCGLFVMIRDVHCWWQDFTVRDMQSLQNDTCRAHSAKHCKTIRGGRPNFERMQLYRTFFLANRSYT